MMLVQWVVWVSDDRGERLVVQVTSPDEATPHPHDTRTAIWKAKRAALPKLRKLDPTLKLADITGARRIG